MTDIVRAAAATYRENYAGEFSALCRFLMLERGMIGNAAEAAAANGAPQKVVEVLKTAIAAGGGSTWGTQLSGYRMMASAFQDTLRNSSILFRLLADAAVIRLPFETQLGSVLTGAAAGVVDPGAGIPVRKMNFGVVALDRIKCAALVVLSLELLSAQAAAEALISRSLRGSVSLAVDTAFISTLMTGVSPSAATANPLTDLRTLLGAVAPTQESRLYFLAAPNTAIFAATVDTGSANQQVFPAASAVGGDLLGIPVLVSSAVPAGQLILVDAAGIGAAADPIELDASQNAAVQMDDAPTMLSTGPGSPDAPVGASVVSMWQTNSACLRALAYFGAVKVRSNAVAALNGVTW